MILVTGGAGFIGSNIIKGLNARGYKDILAVDDLTDGAKYTNLVDCEISDYMDKKEFIDRIGMHYFFRTVEGVFHLGACSDTTEWNGKFMMDNNYEFSKLLLRYALKQEVPFIYASSAAVYGNNQVFNEKPENELPVNVYGYSKYLFDHHVRGMLGAKTPPKSQIVGLRYFNVYGPREQHKGKMASVAFHLNQQLINDGYVRLFEGSGGYEDGEQRRDFVYIDDVVDANLWFYENPRKNGVFNLGTGRSQSFNDVARAIIDWHGRGQIKYIPFPEHLRGHYQSYTQADLTALRAIGYTAPFKSVEEGVKLYMDRINRVRNETQKMPLV